MSKTADLIKKCKKPLGLYLSAQPFNGYGKEYVHFIIAGARGRGKSVISLDAPIASCEKYGYCEFLNDRTNHTARTEPLCPKINYQKFALCCQLCIVSVVNYKCHSVLFVIKLVYCLCLFNFSA